MQQELDYIHAWLQQHAPQTLESLNPPASAAEIAAVERATGQILPDALKQFLAVHDGENGISNDAFWGDFNIMLSCQGIIEQYALDQEIGQQLYDPEMETVRRWREQVSKKIIFILGAVKPLTLHPKWIPITNMNGDVMRYLDFDPATGGVAGQIIEVDPENCVYQVIARSFEELLQRYWLDLQAEKYTVNSEGYIESAYDQDVLSWGVPDWLK